ncbi:hypothetical protein LKR43_01565 [Pusillimonas sp. MFBS29]|uniref:YncE family protein n=1 Tax=Pusillimonas sp. MFBS29 TaxID=2886690 RepID=UPI001D12291B|nr:hypothetical protein [Pusillimonas sp. MFBS29]MCC2595020.1 hypothetical protein [Pusillimonas sp. MFBS29]
MLQLFPDVLQRARQICRPALYTALMALALVQSPVHATAPKDKPADYALRVNYLDDAQEGLYEVQYNHDHDLVMTAVINRVRAKDDLGAVYAFDADTLEKRWRLPVPQQAFALAQDRAHDKLFVTHGKNNAIRISRIDIATGKLEATSERLTRQPSTFKGFESLRHMVFVPATNELFVGYSATRQSGEEGERDYKLLVVNADSLTLQGEVEGAFPGTGYGLIYDEEKNLIYTSGTYVNVIDPATRSISRSLKLEGADPKPGNILSLAVDNTHGRIFAAQNIFRSEGDDDGVYVFDLESGKQLGFVQTGIGSISVTYNPELNEAYVSNFRVGTISVIDGQSYEVKRTFNVGGLPNEMALDVAERRLYVGLKDVYSARSSTGDFLAGSKERLLKIDLPAQRTQN